MFRIISGIHSTIGHWPPPSPRDVSGQRGRVEGHRPTETQKGQDDRRGDHGQAQYVALYVVLCANLLFCETQPCPLFVLHQEPSSVLEIQKRNIHDTRRSDKGRSDNSAQHVHVGGWRSITVSFHRASGTVFTAIDVATGQEVMEREMDLIFFVFPLSCHRSVFLSFRWPSNRSTCRSSPRKS